MDEGYEENPLWHILVDTAKALPLYYAHLAYTRDNLFPEEELDAQKLSLKLDIPLGEALVILWELSRQRED